jgi:hypothetical protein
MRFARKPVKLQFDNVRVPRTPAILALKNTASVDIFGQIVPFRRTLDVASGQIDENGSLPYKPRQLSAMARSDRGGSFGPKTVCFGAGQHQRTTLIIRQIVSLSGKLSAENGP